MNIRASASSEAASPTLNAQHSTPNAASPTVFWRADGTPFSPRFDDIYRSAGSDGLGALAQARHVFLGGCGLLADDDAPAAWARQPVWQILETGFGLGLNFLATWHAWRQDPARPARLFYSAVEAHAPQEQDLLQSAAPFPELAQLAGQLAAQWRGLLPGVHRLQFEQGALQLTLAVGDAQPMLEELSGRSDSVFLDGFSPTKNTQMWTPEVLRAVARLARPGARLATWCVAGEVRERLRHCGFTVERVPGLAPKRHALRAVLSSSPRLTQEPASNSSSFPRGNDEEKVAPRTSLGSGKNCLIIGAGLAGASLAWSLAARGWQVTVLARGGQPADGASGLPAGVMAPHVSPDDRPLSRLTRAGVAATFARARTLLREGIDFAECGVLERHESGKRQTPLSWQIAATAINNEAINPLSAPANAQQCQQAGIAADDEHPALWHERAGWLRPAALVRAMLAAPGVRFIGGAQAARIAPRAGGWQALDAAGAVLAQADFVLLAAGYGTLALLAASAPENAAAAWPLHALRGQLAFGPLPETSEGAGAHALPPFSVNGHGFFAALGGPDAIWTAGATFVREDTRTDTRPEEHAANRQRLAELLPTAAALLAPQWDDGRARAQAAVRCTVPDRLPMVGPLPWTAALDETPPPWALTGLGSRGLTLAVLAGEITAAWLHGEPLPVERTLAHLLRASRWSEKNARSARRAHPPGGPV
ncbi:MAG: FAD-dependent 5-carboxymethylaminomethyl-2-thiouridine(34) oxidoreductase MnmC [Burkholderiaceae bacterium]|jgi:tRNA 5-methylaminomethyl-2-thiouridine biosynthesis bifunctional protein|nr:FAD-dependent 5-carboxymethylaminomethyl-2-thiouridine(34) oxidoreductase MnmC [Burkholderiaceae bacterium]